MGKKDKEKPQPDIGRLGIFKEEPYIYINTPYIPLDTLIWNEPAQKGKQMITKVPGPKDGTSRGYFTPFIRTFEGDAVTDPLKLYRQERRQLKKKYYAGEFIPSNPGKKILGPGCGHYYGTFRGPVRAFRRAVRKVTKLPEKKNVKIIPPKGGGGYGTVDCCMNIYPKAMDPHEPKTKIIEKLEDEEQPLFYNFQKYPAYIVKNPFYTDPTTLRKPKKKPISGKLRLARLATGMPFKSPGAGKSIGGNKDGCFTNYSKFSPYVENPMRRKKIDYAPLFTIGSKSSTFASTIQSNVQKHVTPLTYKTTEGVMYIKPKKEVVFAQSLNNIQSITKIC